MTRPPPLFRHPAHVTTPASAATTVEPAEFATSTAKCPALKYWVIIPPGTGHAKAPLLAAATVATAWPDRSVAPIAAVTGAGSGVALGSTGAGVGLGLSEGRAAGAPRVTNSGSSSGCGESSKLTPREGAGSAPPARAVETRPKSSEAPGCPAAVT